MRCAVRGTGTTQHLRSRNEILNEGAYRLLLHVLVSREEEKFVTVLVEAGARNDHWAAQSASGIVITIGILWDRLARNYRLILEPPVVGIERPVSGIHIRAAVKVFGAALADGLEGHRTLGSFRTVGSVQDRDFLCHILIDVCGLGSLIARVHNLRAVRGHG